MSLLFNLPVFFGLFGISAGAAVALGAGALNAGVGLYTASKNRTAANKAADKVAANQLDIADVISKARTVASDNLQNSIGLLEKMSPGAAANREASSGNISDILAGKTAGLQARNSLLSGITSSNPLLQAASDSLMKQLKLGGKLDPQTQAAATQAALQNAGGSGISGSGAQRGLVARDLGLTSLSLQQARQQAALTGGQAMSQDFAQRAGFATNASGQDIASGTNIAQLLMMQAQGAPNSGLSAGDVASMYTGQNNAQNQNTMNRAANLAQANNATSSALGGLVGSLGTFAGSFTSPTSSLSSSNYSVPSNLSASSGGMGTLLNPNTNFGNTVRDGSTLSTDWMNFGPKTAVLPIFGGSCWVAREVYGETNPRWMLFRAWMLDDSPSWFRNAYLKHGPRVAIWLKGRNVIKGLLRRWMDSRINLKFLA